jgi:hypothetical protein
MAGRGRAPKPPEQRRNRTPPARGEWVDLPELEKAVLPLLPKRPKGTGKWSARTRSAWMAWRADPVTAQYGPADIQAAIDLAYVYEEWVRGRPVADEIRQRQDRLGLNPKGKRDLRWRLPQPAEVHQLDQARGSRGAKPRRLRAVEAASK